MPTPRIAEPFRAEEPALVARAARGELDAFEAIYRGYVGRVFALCLRLSGDRVRAQELTQDVFVRLWERIGSWRGESAFGSWLHRLAVNVVLMDERAARRRRSRVTLVDDAREDEPDPRVEGIAPAGAPEVRLDLERALARLPAGARTVFVLHDVEGYRHDEIARMTGSAEGTSRAQLHRARRLLMQALEESDA